MSPQLVLPDPVLLALFAPVHIAEQVSLELDMGKLLHPDTINPRSLVWVELVSVSQGLIHSLPPNRLGTGERAVIAYAQAHRGYVAGMDDLRARQLAEAIGLKVTGTLETLLRAKQSGLTPAAESIRGSRVRARELADSLPNAIYIEQHPNPANAQSHADTTAEEIWRDTDGRLDIFVHGLGSCGTMTGMARALKARKPSLRCIGFEPEGAALLSQGEFKPHRLLGIGPGVVPGLYDPGLLDGIITVRVEDAFTTYREMAAREGVLAGIASGASAYVALDLARRPEHAGKTIVIIFADAGQGYMSTPGFFDA